MKQKTIATRHLRTKIAAGYPCRRICSNKTNVPADLHVLLSTAKNLPELSIRIFNPLASYFLINRYVFRIADPDTLCCRIAYPTEH